ncbi:MAG TPA: transporter substrate-binding domain-containing protein, partial [Tepidiformaceae bacterium]|nr:transporter substrate-binding domain-containing protein [Tepidiformaceae bacterium]
SVAAVTGGVQPQWLRSTGEAICKKAGKPPINVLTFTDAAGEQLALREGKAQALMENYPTAVVFAQDSKGALELVPNLQVLKTYFAMVIPQSDKELAHALQQAWDTIMKNGTYDKIMTKWGMQGIEIHEAYIDGATSHPPAN